jgi:hypothetical protein
LREKDRRAARVKLISMYCACEFKWQARKLERKSVALTGKGKSLQGVDGRKKVEDEEYFGSVVRRVDLAGGNERPPKL